MKFWPFRRRKCTDAPDELDAAHREVDRAIHDTKQLHRRADEVVGRLEKTWEKNHFGDAVRRRMRGEAPT
jgi:hypothetical protein